MSNVTHLENQKTQAKELIARREAAIRLHSNPDFKKLIVDGFMLEEAARYVQLSQDPSLEPHQQTDALRLAQASGHLKRFLQVTIQLGNTAEGEMGDLDEMIEEARIQEDEEDAEQSEFDLGDND